MRLSGLALASLWNRRGTALLTIAAVALSVTLVLVVQMTRQSAREGFANTVSGVDLVVGSRSGELNLLLYSVFHVGNPTAAVGWDTYARIARHRDVAWTIPLQLGDSHRGFRVVGTTEDFFRHFRHGDGEALRTTAGAATLGEHDAVLGADVARELAYAPGTRITLSHGVGEVSFLGHDGHPLTVAGILARTGTPVDRAVYVGLEALGHMHGAGATHGDDPHEHAPPESISAFMVGMKDRVMTLTMQRALNTFRGEPLQAILPAATLTELWRLVGVADAALMFVAGCVVLAGLLGMQAAILTSLNERRREMAILRSVGAAPRHVLGLMVFEAGVLAATGIALGVLLAMLLFQALRPVVLDRLGVALGTQAPGAYEWLLLAGIWVAALLMSLIPALRAYRNTLVDGLSIRV